MNKYAIEVKNLNLKYRFVSNISIKQAINSLLFPKNKEKRVTEIAAIKNVDFELEAGKSLGIIGSNGAGKTTLLKTIAGIIKPDSGSIKLNTESISLLTLGAGFQSELSGIDNIYINGLLLGFSKDDITIKLNEIIEFAGLENAIKQPLKTYSSGMKSRLAFSISAFIEPDILLIDEILGVGDKEFKVKSKNKMREIISDNRTVVIVSHDLNSIKSICDKVLWLEKGEVKRFGICADVINEYKNWRQK